MSLAGFDLEKGRPSQFFNSRLSSSAVKELRSTMAEVYDSIMHLQLVTKLRSRSADFWELIDQDNSRSESLSLMCDGLFQQSRQDLDHDRPEFSLNNFNDATNLAFLVWATSARRNTFRNLNPVLISKSKHVQKHAVKSPTGRHLPEIVNSQYYLLLYEMFVSQNDGDVEIAYERRKHVCKKRYRNARHR